MTIVFADGDAVEGPMHTDDATDICGKAYFGRKGHNPPDAIQMNYGVYSTCGGSEGVFYNSTGKPEVGPELLTPEGDTSLATYVKEGGEEFTGSTHIVLNGSENTMSVTNSKNETKVEPWPENGLVYVRASTNSREPCNYTFKDSPTETDDTAEVEKETHCGDVYVKRHLQQAAHDRRRRKRDRSTAISTRPASRANWEPNRPAPPRSA